MEGIAEKMGRGDRGQVKGIAEGMRRGGRGNRRGGRGNSILQRKSQLCIPFLGIARPQSQFPHS